METKDVLHYYIGQKCLRPDGKTILDIYGLEGSLVVHREGDGLTYSGAAGCKSILKRLQDMTIEELTELFFLGWESMRELGINPTFEMNPKPSNKHGTGKGYVGFKDGKHYVTGTLSLTNFNPPQFHYLLSQGYDLFSLIDNGNSIDSKTLTPPSNNS